MMLSINNRKAALCLLGSLLLAGWAGAAETRQAHTRSYYQIKDVAAQEKGDVRQSTSKKDLFEYCFKIDRARQTITRTSVRRLDKPKAEKDNTVYKIMKKYDLIGSDAGQGGRVLVAVRQDGGEILELGHRFAFTMRVSPFSQVITGIYRRNYAKDRGTFPRHSKPRQPR